MSHALLSDMTQPQTVNVEKEEILARAVELEEPIPGLPTENPQAPCSHAVAKEAARQLALSADRMRDYLRMGQRERGRLAESLREAAKAYDEVDEGAGEAINGGTSASAVTPRPADVELDAMTLNDTPVAAAAGGPEYADLKQTAWEIEDGDQGVAFERFAEEWTAYQERLQEVAFDRFRPFEHWDGEAAYAVEALFDQHRSWLFDMADLCQELVAKARAVVAAQRRALSQHVLHTNGNLFNYELLVWVDKAYKTWHSDPIIRAHYLDLYAKLQRKSDEVVAEYTRAATLGRVNPPMPPLRKIGPPADLPVWDPGGGIDVPGGGPGVPDDGPSLEDQLPTLPTTPSMPTLPMDDSALTDALPEVPSYPIAGSTGSGLKPASFGGGAAGGGVPSMPLKTPFFPEPSPSVGTAAARDLAGLGRLAPGGAMGAGGMGAPPMGGGKGAGQGENKGKRAGGEDESLYTEDRAWTEGILGHRRPPKPTTAK